MRTLSHRTLVSNRDPSGADVETMGENMPSRQVEKYSLALLALKIERPGNCVDGHMGLKTLQTAFLQEQQQIAQKTRTRSWRM